MQSFDYSPHLLIIKYRLFSNTLNLIIMKKILVVITYYQQLDYFSCQENNLPERIQKCLNQF